MEMIIASLWLLVNKSCGAQSMGQAVHWASPLKRVSNHLRCWETILANRRKEQLLQLLQKVLQYKIKGFVL